MSRIPALVVVVLLAAGAALAVEPHSVALLLDDGAPATRLAAAAAVTSLGGRVIHAFDGVLVVELPAGSEFRALRLTGVREVALNGISPKLGPPSVPGWGPAAWNAIARVDEGGRHSDEPIPESLEADALVPPSVSLEEVRAASRLGTSVSAAVAPVGSPFGATDLNTSEFFAGAVSVNIILVESDGSIDSSSENWTADRESQVVAGIAAGLEWDRLQEPQATLRFVYHVVAGRVSPVARTGYEPIRRAADPSGTTGEDLWVKQILAKMGYASGDRFARARALDSDTRRVDGTDWAVTIFVVDSLNDTDGKFADGRFAYTWIGGPHMVMTYDNQAWGIARMDMVVRHEILHAFYAYDEYVQSACACGDHRGYLDGVNANCNTCNAVAGACVMIANGDAMCDATRRQIGWADLDGDGVIDVVGEDPDTFLDPLPSAVCSSPTLAGVATVVAATNRNPFTGTPRSNISINRIASVEVRADGAAWMPASPEDGAWGTPQERFHAAYPPLATGPHRLEARAIDDHGNVDLAPGAADVVVQGSADPLGDTMRASRTPSGGATVAWSSVAGAVSYRVYRAASGLSGWTELGVTAGTSWTDETAASGYYQVRPVDACGVERPD